MSEDKQSTVKHCEDGCGRWRAISYPGGLSNWFHTEAEAWAYLRRGRV